MYVYCISLITSPYYMHILDHVQVTQVHRNSTCGPWFKTFSVATSQVIQLACTRLRRSKKSVTSGSAHYSEVSRSANLCTRFHAHFPPDFSNNKRQWLFLSLQQTTKVVSLVARNARGCLFLTWVVKDTAKDQVGISIASRYTHCQSDSGF